MKRLFSYLKHHKKEVLFSCVLVLLIIVVELYRPIIIGNAIDSTINNYGKPVLCADGTYQTLFLYDDRYYLAEGLSQEECEELQSATADELSLLAADRTPLKREELKVLRAPDLKNLFTAAGLYLLMLVLGYIFNALNTWNLQLMGQKIIYKLREQTFGHIHSLSLCFFNNTPVGKLVTRVSNDTEAVNELFATILVKLFKNTVMIAGYAVVMLSINGKLAAVSFAVLPLIGFMTFFFRYVSRKAYRLTRERITDLNTFLSEHISGMNLIKIFVREERKYNEFEERSTGLYRANLREIMVFAVFRPLIFLVAISARILIIGTGAKGVLCGTLSLGTLYIFITYISSFFEPIQELAEQFGTLQSSIASAEKIFSVLDEKPVIVNAADARKMPFEGRIEFKNVWFAYEKEDYILKDVSFVIEPGKSIAFVGATGAGKSTILNLIGRYFDIQSGQILVDGTDIREIDTDVLRSAIGQVQQDVFLFTGSIRSNISLGNEKITDETIEKAIHTVNADTFIDQLPGGLDAPITERGSTLSAGERQLLSFARTLAYDPKILVLDEATANIDTETEHLITQALNTLMTGRTTIMVAHRLSTIQHADMILVLDHGQVVESGNHQELLNRNGIYRKLYDLQATPAE